MGSFAKDGWPYEWPICWLAYEPQEKPAKYIIRHPALKSVKVLVDGMTLLALDDLSNLNEYRIEDAIEIPVQTPSIVEVTTLTGKVFSFIIPRQS